MPSVADGSSYFKCLQPTRPSRAHVRQTLGLPPRRGRLSSDTPPLNAGHIPTYSLVRVGMYPTYWGHIPTYSSVRVGLYPTYWGEDDRLSTQNIRAAWDGGTLRSEAVSQPVIPVIPCGAAPEHSCSHKSAWQCWWVLLSDQWYSGVVSLCGAAIDRAGAGARHRHDQGENAGAEGPGRARHARRVPHSEPLEDP